MTSIVLSFHIVGALVTVILIVKAIIDVLSNRLHVLRPRAVQLGYCICYQVITGALLAILASQKISPILFCNKIGLYLGIVGLVELFLFIKVKSKPTLFFPIRVVLASFTISIIVTISTAFYLQF